MPGPAQILREIHRLRRFASDLQAEIDRGPRTLKTQQARLTRQEDALRDWHNGIKQLKVATLEKESSLRSKNQQIIKHEMQREQSTSKKEYDAFQAEIASDRRACAKLEDDIINDMAETEERIAKIPELELAVRQAKEELAQFEKSFQERQANLDQQLKQTLEQLKETENSIPEDIRPVYDRLVVSKGEDAMAMVEGRTCTACYTEITAQNYNDLVMNQFLVCKSCGRALYLPE